MSDDSKKAQRGRNDGDEPCVVREITPPLRPSLWAYVDPARWPDALLKAELPAGERSARVEAESARRRAAQVQRRRRQA
jgi:hypothetical protein